MSQYSFYFCDVYPTNQYDDDSVRYKNLSADLKTSIDSNSTSKNRSSIMTILFGSNDDTETINLYNKQKSDDKTSNNSNNSFYNKIFKYLCCCFTPLDI